MTPRAASLVCAEGHNFDPSRKGHVNFVPHQRPMKYTQELFLARGRIFEDGFYAPILDRIRTIIEKHRTEQGLSNLTIVDAGCGQGYYAKALAQTPADTVIGFDLSADAVAQAATGVHDALFMVADLTNIPLADGSADIILDILTQANYSEFSRILKPGGILIKVIPDEAYLLQIRQMLTGLIRKDAHSDESVTRHFCANFDLQDTAGVHVTRPVTSRQAEDLLLMTPMTLNIDTNNLPIQDLQAITLHLKILVGAPQENAL